MKSFLLAALMLPISCFSQNNLEGVGKFKIGKTTIDELPGITGIKINQVKNYDEDKFSSLKYGYSKRGELFTQYLIEVVPDEKGTGYKYVKYPDYFIEGYRFVYLGVYENASIKLTGIELSFYRDTLIDFKCNWDWQISFAMKQKYGEPEKTLKENKVMCRYKFTGAEIEKIELEQTESWVSGDIYAYVYSHSYQSEKCEDQIDAYFKVFSKDKYNEYMLYLSERRKINAEKTKSENEKKYKDW